MTVARDGGPTVRLHGHPLLFGHLRSRATRRVAPDFDVDSLNGDEIAATAVRGARS